MLPYLKSTSNEKCCVFKVVEYSSYASWFLLAQIYDTEKKKKPSI